MIRSNAWWLLIWVLVASCDDGPRGATSADGDAQGALPDSAVIDAVSDAATVDTVSDTSAVDAVNDTSAVDAVSDAAAVDTVSDAATVDAVSDTSAVDTARETTVDTAIDVTEDALATCPVCSARRPLILVHGIGGGPENFDVMVQWLLADGWPAEDIVRFEAQDPSWGCNVDNAAALAELVDSLRVRSCQGRVDIVAHSMGTLSSRYYVKNLGGTERVNAYVTLGGMHHGLFSPCLAPGFLGVCVWQELCQTGEYIAQLNADPATPGALHWVSIYGSADVTVPNDSSHLEGAENILIEGAEHDGVNGLLQREDAYAEVKRVLGYDCW